jgi:hypothetical protein
MSTRKVYPGVPLTVAVPLSVACWLSDEDADKCDRRALEIDVVRFVGVSQVALEAVVIRLSVEVEVKAVADLSAAGDPAGATDERVEGVFGWTSRRGGRMIKRRARGSPFRNGYVPVYGR